MTLGGAWQNLAADNLIARHRSKADFSSKCVCHTVLFPTPAWLPCRQANKTLLRRLHFGVARTFLDKLLPPAALPLPARRSKKMRRSPKAGISGVQVSSHANSTSRSVKVH